MVIRDQVQYDQHDERVTMVWVVDKGPGSLEQMHLMESGTIVINTTSRVCWYSSLDNNLGKLYTFLFFTLFKKKKTNQYCSDGIPKFSIVQFM